MEREGRKIQSQGMELEMMLKPGGREIRKCKENKMTKGQKKYQEEREKNTCVKMCHSPRHGSGTNSTVE